MLSLCLMLSGAYYAKNYAGMISSASTYVVSLCYVGSIRKFNIICIISITLNLYIIKN